MPEEFTINLTRDQAFVLSHWLDEVIGTQEFDAIVNRDRAVWSPLHHIAGTLETTLPEIFAKNYSTHLAAARERLLHDLGDVGLPTTDD